ALDGGDHLGAVAFFIQLIIPTAPANAASATAAAPAEADHADIIAGRKCLDGFDGALLAPVVAVGHLATVDDQNQRTLGHLPLRRDVHVDREHFLDLGSLPAARAK